MLATAADHVETISHEIAPQHGPATQEDAARPPRQVVCFGPYLGEFGHEVRTWAPYANLSRRVLREEGGEAAFVAASQRGRAGLYGMTEEASNFFAVAVPGGYDSQFLGLAGPRPQEAAEAVRHVLAERIYERCGEDVEITFKTPPLGAAWQGLHTGPLRDLKRSLQCERCSYDPIRATTVPSQVKMILIFARYRMWDAHRNYTMARWAKVVASLRERLGEDVDIVSGGTREQNSHIEGTMDARCDTPDARETINLIGSAGLVLGESSGPMHLAALCNAPCVVFGEARVADRYLEDACPHSPLTFLRNLAPAPEIVAREAHRIISAVGGSDRWTEYLGHRLAGKV